MSWQIGIESKPNSIAGERQANSGNVRAWATGRRLLGRFRYLEKLVNAERMETCTMRMHGPAPHVPELPGLHHHSGQSLPLLQRTAWAARRGAARSGRPIGRFRSEER